jgi:hypothetical protein
MGITNLGGNSTAASIVEPVPMTTVPNRASASSGVVSGFKAATNYTDGVIEMGAGGDETSSAILLMFFGVGANGTTFNCNVYGWEETVMPTTGLGLPLFVPRLLCQLTAITLNSSIPGVASTLVPAIDPVSTSANYFASAMTLTLGNSGISAEVISPGSGTAEIASLVLSTKGAKMIELRFNMNSSATSGNAIWKRM